MGYSNIKRVLATALLLAFTAPVQCAYTNSYYNAYAGTDSMTLSSDVQLTNNNQLITLSLRDSDVKQVLRMFADKAGMNIVFHSSVNGKVTLDLVETPINEAFNLVLQIAGLNYYKQGNAMIIMSKDSADNTAFSKQEMMVFPVNYVSAESIANFLNRNVFSMNKAGMSGTEAATVNSATNEIIVFGMPSDAAIVRKVIAQFDKEPFSKTFAVSHTTPEEMATMICDLLLPASGMGASGGSSGSKGKPIDVPRGTPGMSTGGAAGVITGAAADSSESGGLDALKLGEGIVACSMSGSTDGSVAPFDIQNLSIAYFPQRGTITLMGGSEAQANMIEKFIRAHDIKQPQAYLEVAIIELNESGSKDFQNMWEVAGAHWGFKFDGAGTEGGHRGLGNTTTNMRPVTLYIDGVDAETGAPVQNVIDNYMIPIKGCKISWVMNYVISNNKGRVLANPKILITNGQESVIDLTEDYVEKVTSEFLTSTSAGGDSTTGLVQKEYTIGDDLGIKVSLIPFISPEGYVTLNIKPDYSTIKETIGEGVDLAATLLSRRNLDIKNARIRDGETLVLGGMLKESETKSVSKIPFLGDLPLIGAAFRSSNSKKSKNELVIMITPNIINDGEGAIADSI